MIVSDNPEVRVKITDWYRELDGLGMDAPSSEMIEAYQDNLPDMRDMSHQTNRGKHDIAKELGMRVAELENLLAGKLVLDVGCGEGVFAREASRLKRTHVLGIDYDPDIIADLPTSKQLEFAVGSGFDVQAVIGDATFDVVTVPFSSFTWATTPEDKLKAIDSPLAATNPGGTVMLIPLAQHLNYRRLTRQALANGKVLGFPHATKEDVERLGAACQVAEWMDYISIGHLFDMEQAGSIECAFRASLDNARGLSLHPVLSGPLDPRQESYSVAIQT